MTKLSDPSAIVIATRRGEMKRKQPGGNPARIRGVQDLRRSSAAGTHQQRVTRAEQIKSALRDEEDYQEEDNYT